MLFQGHTVAVQRFQIPGLSSLTEACGMVSIRDSSQAVHALGAFSELSGRLVLISTAPHFQPQSVCGFGLLSPKTSWKAEVLG